MDHPEVALATVTCSYDAGGSRRSYRSGRASAVAEGTPFPEGPPKSSVGGVPGWHLSSSACAGLLPGYASMSFVISVRAYPPFPEGADRQRFGPSGLLCVAETRATRPNGEWGYSTRRQCCWRFHLEEALYLPTFSHLFDCQ
jgi:hypothetical protein